MAHTAVTATICGNVNHSSTLSSACTWCWRPGSGASWSRARPPRRWCRSRTPRRRRCYRERLKTTVVSLDLGDGEIVEIAA